MKSALRIVVCGVLLLGIVFVLSVGASAQGQVSFFMPPTYAGSGTMFVADFNGDGKPDILSGDGTLQLGTGNGTFTTGTPVTAGALAGGLHWQWEGRCVAARNRHSAGASGKW
jgi:hypothetical protein